MKQAQVIRIVHTVRRDVAISVVIALAFIAIVFVKLLNDPFFAPSPVGAMILRVGPFIASGIVLIGFAVGMFRARKLRLFDAPTEIPEPTRLGKKF